MLEPRSRSRLSAALVSAALVSAALVSAALSAALVGGCSSDGTNQELDDEVILQLKLETAQRVVAELHAAHERPRYADCKSAQLLFLEDLKQLKSPEARRVADELVSLCASAQPTDPPEVAR